MMWQRNLLRLKESDKIGVQQGTTGQYYVEGSEEWDFPGLPAKCVTYKSGSHGSTGYAQWKYQVCDH